MVLNSASAVLLSRIPAGNLMIMRTPAGPLLGMRATVPDGTTNAVVLFEADKTPTYLPLQADPLCVDLGVHAAVRVTDLPGAFTHLATAYVVGNLAIEGKSVCIIAVVPGGPNTFGGEVLVEVATGKVMVSGGAERWYAQKWQFGHLDARGEFVNLWAKG